MSKSITIKVIEPRPEWRPGETILGEVHLNAMEQVDIESISITFKGKAKARYTRSNGQSSTTYRSKVHLFYATRVLFKGPFTLSPGKMSWPFEFTIPINCKWSKGDKSPGDNVFDGNDEQPLPPSFSSSASHRDASVEYMLQAVMSTSRTFGFSRDAILPIYILPPRTMELSAFQRVIAPNTHNVRTLHLDPEIQDRSLSFKEKMRSTFKSETLPMSWFTIKLDLPTAAAFYEPLRPVLLLEHDLRRSTAPEIPIVYLTSFSISLKFDVFIKVSGFTSDKIQDWSDTVHINSWTGRIPLPEYLDVSEIMRTNLPLRAALAPSFRTYNVSVNYRWKVKYTIECATKTRDAQQTRPCVVLGPPLSTGQMASQLEGPLQAVVDEGEQLPAYTKASS